MQHIAIADKNRRRVELSRYLSFAANLRKLKVASRYRAFSSSCDLFIGIVLNFDVENRSCNFSHR